jgi:hypothetical protein
LIKKEIQGYLAPSGLRAGVIIAEMAAGTATFLHTLMGLIEKHTGDWHMRASTISD